MFIHPSLLLLRGRSFFQPGTRLEHFLRGLKFFSRNLRGLKKIPKNLRGLKIFASLAFKGSKIFQRTTIRGLKIARPILRGPKFAEWNLFRKPEIPKRLHNSEAVSFVFGRECTAADS